MFDIYDQPKGLYVFLVYARNAFLTSVVKYIVKGFFTLKNK